MSCETCKKTEVKHSDGKGQSIPFVVHESAMARNERNMKRLVIALIAAIVLIFASNAIWLYAWMQYDYSSEETVTEYKQDGEGLNIIGDRNTAGIYDESERDD
jgi:uncharacterized paraquat-inducible protein A